MGWRRRKKKRTPDWDRWNGSSDYGYPDHTCDRVGELVPGCPACDAIRASRRIPLQRVNPTEALGADPDTFNANVRSQVTEPKLPQEFPGAEPVFEEEEVTTPVGEVITTFRSLKAELTTDYAKQELAGARPPFPSFAASAVAQIEAGLMDGWLNFIIKTATDRQNRIDPS